MTRCPHIGGAVLLLTLAACAAPRPKASLPPLPRADVAYRAVDDVNAPHYHPDSLQVAIAPTTGRGNPDPVYPPDLVARHLPPLHVRAKLIVDATGLVTDVRIADAANADPTTALFDAAVRRAVLHWFFAPLQMTTWKDLPDGSSKRVGVQALPFSQDYLFTFRLVDGKPVVSTGASGGKSNR